MLNLKKNRPFPGFFFDERSTTFFNYSRVIYTFNQKAFLKYLPPKRLIFEDNDSENFKFAKFSTV